MISMPALEDAVTSIRLAHLVKTIASTTQVHSSVQEVQGFIPGAGKLDSGAGK